MLRIHNMKTFIAFILVAVILSGCVLAIGYNVFYPDQPLTASEDELQPLNGQNQEDQINEDIVTLSEVEVETRTIEEQDVIEIPITVVEPAEEEVTEEVTPVEAEPEHTIHVVGNYDSWWGIAQQYYNDGNKSDELAKYNGLTDSSILQVGQEIIIPKFLVDSNTLQKSVEVAEDTIKDSEVIVTEDGTKDVVTVMKASTEPSTYQYGVRSAPKVDITIPTGDVMKNNTGVVDVSNFTYYGFMTTTGYNPTCAHCCGSTAGIGAAGVKIIPGYSVAAPAGIALGTTIYIEGYGFYVVEDRGGFGSNNIDIACPTDESAANVTNCSGVNVYIVG